MSGARWFLPYLTVSIVHVVGLAFGADDPAYATKFLLMPALILAVVGRVRLRLRAAEVALLVALACAWIGDIFDQCRDCDRSGSVLGWPAIHCRGISVCAGALGGDC